MPINSSNSYDIDLPIKEGSKLHAPNWAINQTPKDYDEYGDVFWGGRSERGGFTKLDLFNLEGRSRESIRKLIFNILHIKTSASANTINKQLPRLNRIYKNSLEFLERWLYRKIPSGLKTKEWKSVDEFVENVFEHTSRNTKGAYSLLFCVILKVMLIEEDVDENSKIDSLDEDMALLMNHFEWIREMQKIKNKNTPNDEYDQFILNDSYKIQVEHRPKSIDSIRTKEIYNRSYSSSESFRDLLALRIELDPKRGQAGYVHTICSIRDGLYGENTRITLELKGGILDDSSIRDLEIANITVKVKDRKWGTSLYYEDAKFVWGTVAINTGKGKKKKHVSPEVQFVLPWNKNEANFSRHEVYSLKKILSANCRLFWALTTGNLKYMLEQYETGIDHRKLLEHLLYPPTPEDEPFLQILRKKDSNGKIKHYFITNDVLFWEAQKEEQKMLLEEELGEKWAGKQRERKVPRRTLANFFGNTYPEVLSFHDPEESHGIADVLEFVHQQVDSIIRSRAEN